jgi:response regulator RpfG family c-di-GMP phosphodiesterase
MPEMDGARFLARVNEIAPQTVRMVLSGQADLESTIAAVNEGRVFRFLLKPCNSETLFGVIKNGIEQYRLIHAEKHLLENTLNATVKVLCDVLGLINPVAQRRAAQIQRYAESAAAALPMLPHLWQYHLAAMVSQLGCITLPQETLSRAIGGQALSDESAGSTSPIPRSRASCWARFRAWKPWPAWSRARCRSRRAISPAAMRRPGSRRR